MCYYYYIKIWKEDTAIFSNNLNQFIATKQTKCVEFGCRNQSRFPKRGDIFYSDLSPVVGSEQGGIRPVLIVQNDTGNKYSPTIIVAAITSQITKAKIPTHIELKAYKYGLHKDSVILLEQIRTLDKKRLKSFISCLSLDKMQEIDDALMISFGLINQVA